MQPRLDIGFSWAKQKAFCFGNVYIPQKGEYMLNHARSGIVMALQTILPQGGRVGVVAYNCYTVANAVVEAGCTPIFIDVTSNLYIDVADIARKEMDAIVVTNLFGIHNDIASIQQVLGNKPIIVDNAHGYGLPNEGDVTVYSINQGKFPALGEGGILVVNNDEFKDAIHNQYIFLPCYSKWQEIKLYLTMLIKAWMHIPFIYSLITKQLKGHRGAIHCQERITMRRMAKGVNRLYMASLSSIPQQIVRQQENAQLISNDILAQKLVTNVWYGENAFMVIARCDNPEELSQYFVKHGVETATHFANCILWAKQFGYTEGDCPMAEKLTKELLMIPTYKKI